MATVKHIENVEVLLDGLDPESITSILDKCNEIAEVRNKLNEIDEMLRDKVKSYLKERSWITYNDPMNKMSVSITTQKREDIDKVQLKLMLSPQQLQQVTKIVSFEKMMIVSEATRKKMKAFIK